MRNLVYLDAHLGHLRTAAGGTLIVPVTMLVGNVVIHPHGATTPELVPLSLLAQNPHAWNGKPLCLGHPTRNGTVCSAASPEGSAASFGEIRNARFEHPRLCADLVIDEAKGARIGAGDVLWRLRRGEQLEVSVGCHVVTAARDGVHGGKRYAAVWQTIQPDHVAIVERGACSCADGCGTHRAAAIHQEENMESYEPINPYAEHLKRIRAAASTAPTFAERFANMRRQEFELQQAEVDARETPRLTAAEEADLASYEPPDPYKADLERMMKESR